MRECERSTEDLAYVEIVEGPDGELIRALVVGGAIQSATYLGERAYEPVFAYYRAFDCMFEGDRTVRDVLMLGGGGYAYPKHFISTQPDARMDVVEINPAVTQLAMKHFSLQQALDEFGRDRLCLVTADARTYVDSCTKTYDVIVNDCFTGTEPVRSLMTAEAAHTFARCLVPGGLYLANVVSQQEGTDVTTLSRTAAALSEAFANIQVIPCSDDDYSAEDNYLVAASNGPLSLCGAVPFSEEFFGAVLHDA